MSDALTDNRSQCDPKDPPLSLKQAHVKVMRTANNNRVTVESIKARIKSVDYLVHGVTTVCIITLQNGFKVVGHSTPADLANFKADVGQAYAYDNAFRQIWQLEGYLLCERMHGDGGVLVSKLKASITDVLTKF